MVRIGGDILQAEFTSLRASVAVIEVTMAGGSRVANYGQATVR